MDTRINVYILSILLKVQNVVITLTLILALSDLQKSRRKMRRHIGM